MGTKLEYAINLLATSANCNSFTVPRVDDLDYFPTRGVNKSFQITGLDIFQDHMDRMPEKHNLDFIKKTMQMQEDVFMHQVRELHRLYSVQKMLMDELKKEINQHKYWSSVTSSDVNHSQFTNQHPSPRPTNCGYKFHDPSSRERSGSCSRDTMRMTWGFDLERPADEEITAGVSLIKEDQAGSSSHMLHKSMKMSMDGSDDDSEVELTLSIGGASASKKKSNNNQLDHHSQEPGCSEPAAHKDIRPQHLDSSASFKSDQGEDCSGPATPISSSSATTFDQERKRPHWLFQGLSINRT